MQLLAYNFPKTHFLFENNESFYQQIKYVSIFVKKKKKRSKAIFFFNRKIHTKTNTVPIRMKTGL